MRAAKRVGTSAFVLGLHLALYLALTASGSAPVPESAADAPAALMISLQPISVTAKSAVDNAAPGPESVASDAVPEPPEVTEPPPPPPPLPVTIPDMPAPPEVTSAAVLPPTPPEPAKTEVKPPDTVKREVKPKHEPPKVKPKPEVKKPIERPAAVAAKAGGGPISDLETGKITTAAVAGAAVGSGVTKTSWLADVRTRIVRAKRYPPAASARGETGVALVMVGFSSSGAVTSARLAQSSGSALLDEEAVAVMHRAEPYPPPPENVATTVAIPINFNRR